MPSNTMRREFCRRIVFRLTNRMANPVNPARRDCRARLDLGFLEGWSIRDSIYFAFVSGLTIGYGDLAPKTFLARMLAILIGTCGLLMTTLIAAVAVKALTAIRAGAEK